MMKNDHAKPLDALNAYLDGELSPGKAATLEQRLRDNPGLQKHLDELRRVRGLMRVAFEDTRTLAAPPLPSQPMRYAVAAGALMLVTGFALGWVVRPTTPALPAAAAVPDDALVLQPARLARTVDSTMGRVLLHIGSSDPGRAQTALGRAERLLARYAREGRRLSFEVVVNSSGLDLLRRTSPIANQVTRLQQQYGNLTFLVCGQTVERWRQERGGDPGLLPGVVVGPPALEHIITRLEEGWAYLRA